MRTVAPDVRAALVAAAWAQAIGLPAGNLWEPGIARGLVREWRRLGASAEAWAEAAGTYRARLGLPDRDAADAPSR